MSASCGEALPGAAKDSGGSSAERVDVATPVVRSGADPTPMDSSTPMGVEPATASAPSLSGVRRGPAPVSIESPAPGTPSPAAAVTPETGLAQPAPRARRPTGPRASASGSASNSPAASPGDAGRSGRSSPGNDSRLSTRPPRASTASSCEAPASTGFALSVGASASTEFADDLRPLSTVESGPAGWTCPTSGSVLLDRRTLTRRLRRTWVDRTSSSADRTASRVSPPPCRRSRSIRASRRETSSPGTRSLSPCSATPILRSNVNNVRVETFKSFASSNTCMLLDFLSGWTSSPGARP